MPNIQIKGVPPETHGVLAARAAARRQSLQAYLLQQLVEFASHPTVDELFDEMDAHSGGGSLTLDDAVNLVREVREEREGR